MEMGQNTINKFGVGAKTLFLSAFFQVCSGDIALAFDNPNSVKTGINVEAVDSTAGMELINKSISPRIVANAALNYFDEEVRLYKLEGKTRKDIETILISYFESHPMLVYSDGGNLKLVIDDMTEFNIFVKKITYTLLNSMNLVIKKIVVKFIFGGGDKLEFKLNNLEDTVKNLKKSVYETIIFDYVGGIVKRAVGDVNGNMSLNSYYSDVSKYFPNDNDKLIKSDIEKSKQGNVNVSKFKYPFN